MIKLYHFYSKTNDNKRIIVGALSFLEAANSAHDLCTDMGDQYNLIEYKLENINIYFCNNYFRNISFCFKQIFKFGTILNSLFSYN